MPSTHSTSTADPNASNSLTKASSKQSSSFQNRILASDSHRTTTGDTVSSVDQSSHSADIVVSAGPKLLQPILKEAILTGKSMEMLENLGRMGDALNINSNICEFARFFFFFSFLFFTARKMSENKI